MNHPHTNIDTQSNLGESLLRLAGYLALKKKLELPSSLDARPPVENSVFAQMIAEGLESGIATKEATDQCNKWLGLSNAL